jgi:hypothetical protein
LGSLPAEGRVAETLVSDGRGSESEETHPLFPSWGGDFEILLKSNSDLIKLTFLNGINTDPSIAETLPLTRVIRKAVSYLK